MPASAPSPVPPPVSGLLSDADKGSIGITLVREALQGARARGHDTDALLRRAGIRPDLLASDRARVSAASYARLWSALADEMDDEFFGMDRHPMRRGSYRLMCHSVLGSTTLEQALQRMLGFLRLVLDDLHATLECRDGRARIVLHEVGDPPRMFARATFFMLVHGLACWLVARRMPLLEAGFAGPEPAAAADYRVRFCEQACFDQPRSWIAFDAAWLTQPVRQDEAALRVFLRGAPANLLVRWRDDGSLGARIRRRLRPLAPADWPDLPALAATLHLSVTTVQRRLRDEGQSYQRVRDGLRRDLALQLLGQGEPGLSVAAVGERLGFEETSAFHRAFKKWTGVSPGAYRQALPRVTGSSG